MRVGYDATNILGHGGIKTYARELITALVEMYPDDEFLLFTTSSRSKAGRLESIFGMHHGISIHRGLPHAEMLGSGLRRLSSILGAAYWRFQERTLDLVHLTDPYSCAGIPGRFVATIHDIFPLTRPELLESHLNRYYRRKTPTILDRARVVITPSEYTASEVKRLYPSTDTPIVVIPDAAGERYNPLERDDEILARYGLRGIRYFLFVGRVDERKNLKRIVESFRSLKEEEGTDAHLALILSGGAFDLNPGITDDIHVLKSLPDSDIPQLYSSAVALVFPSLDEGFGLPVLEAMRCRCPVITSNLGSLPEVAGSAAILVDPKSVAEIRSSMKLLAARPDKRKALQDMGEKQAARFSWRDAADGTMAVYRTTANMT